MKKLALIEDLAVETFSASSDGTAPQRGTVRARSDGPWYTDIMYYGLTFCFSCQPESGGCLPPHSVMCTVEENCTYQGYTCYRISNPACAEWTDAGSTC